MQILTKNQSHGKIIGIFHLHCSQNLTNLESLYFFGFGVFCLGGGCGWEAKFGSRWATQMKRSCLWSFFFIFFIYKKELRLELVVEMVTNKSLRATIDGGRILNLSDSWEKAYGYEIDEAWLCAPNSIA